MASTEEIVEEACVDSGSCGEKIVPKIRKPYTITKQRERWTEEEHRKFLEALHLYGRAWRRIEEHIGTKTTVQIRSHAQKFFSKVMKDQSTINDSTGAAPKIEIPPPRPKRKPAHPYPRKLGNHLKKELPALKQLEKPPVRAPSVSEQGTGSPCSVLSTVGSNNFDSAFSNSQSACKSPVESAVGSNEQETGNQSPTATSAEPEQACPTHREVLPTTESDQSSTDTQAPTIKLFGKTVVVTDLPNSSLSKENTSQLPESSNNLGIEVDQRSKDMDVDSVNVTATQMAEQWPSGFNPFLYYLPFTSEGVISPVPSLALYGNWTYPVINNNNHHQMVIQDSNVDRLYGVEKNIGERELELLENANEPMRGFVPYRR